jgi:hypothetical protein
MKHNSKKFRPWPFPTVAVASVAVAICKLQAKRASLDHARLTAILFGYQQKK